MREKITWMMTHDLDLTEKFCSFISGKRRQSDYGCVSVSDAQLMDEENPGVLCRVYESSDVCKAGNFRFDYSLSLDAMVTVFQKADRSRDDFIFFAYLADGNIFMKADQLLAIWTYIHSMGLSIGSCYVYPVEMVDGRVVSAGTLWGWDGVRKLLREYWCEFVQMVFADVSSFEYVLQMSGMNLREFSEHFGIKYRTVQNWHSGVSEVPSWALPLFMEHLQNYKKSH